MVKTWSQIKERQEKRANRGCVTLQDKEQCERLIAQAVEKENSRKSYLNKMLKKVQ